MNHSFLLLIAVFLGACKADPSSDSVTDSGVTDSSEPATVPRTIELGPGLTLTSELTNVLHIAALPDGSILVSEANAPPATRGRLAVVNPDGEIHTLVSDVPVVAFDHDVTYMGPDGITLLDDQKSVIWSLFLGAGDIKPVEDDPDWDPEAGSTLYKVPVYDESGALSPAKTIEDLEIWTQSRNDFIYDLAWQSPETLWATEPGKNALYAFGNDGSTEPVAWPLSKIPIEPVRGQETVEAVPTGLTVFQGDPVVAQLGGGIYQEDGVTPTGERYDQQVGRVSRFTGQEFEDLATGLPSVLDIVSLGDSLVLACFDFYNSTNPQGFLIQLLPDGTMHILESFSDFPHSLAVTEDQLFLMTASGSLLQYTMTFSSESD